MPVSPYDQQILRHHYEQEIAWIRKLVKRIDRRSPLRAQAETLLQTFMMQNQSAAPDLVEAAAQAEISYPVMLDAVRDLSDRRWRERVVAAWMLGRVPLDPEQAAEAIEALGVVLDRDTQRESKRVARRGRGGRAIRRTMLIFSPFFLLMLMAELLNGAGSEVVMVSIILFVVLSLEFSIIVVPAMYAHDEDCVHRGREMAARSLGRLQAAQAVGVLAAACLDTRMRVKQEAMQALEQIAPLLSEEQYGRVRADTTPNLCSLLSQTINRRSGRPRHEGFIIRIIETLEKLGDGRAVPIIERLCMTTDPRQQPLVREAAMRALPVLEERRRLEEASQILLRASTQETGADMLLRAAQQQDVQTPQEQLLRSSQSEDQAS